MRFLLTITFLLFIRQCVAVSDLPEVHGPATFKSVKSMSVLDLPRDAQDRGIFILAERYLPVKNCNPVHQIWSMLTNKTCQSKHYQIYFNGRSIGFLEDRYQDDQLPLSVFLEDYSEHLVVRHYDPRWDRYSDAELNSYILNYTIEYDRDPLSPGNRRQFAMCLCYHFFGVQVPRNELTQRRLKRRIAQMVSAVATVATIVF